MKNIEKLNINKEGIIFNIENKNLQIGIKYPKTVFLIFYILILVVAPTLWINLMISKSVFFALILPLVWFITWGLILNGITDAYNSITFDVKKRILQIRNIDYIGKIFYKKREIEFNIIEKIIIENLTVGARYGSINYRVIKALKSNGEKITLFRFIDGGYLSKYEFDTKELITEYLNK